MNPEIISFLQTLKIGYLKQDGEFESENTVIEEVDRIFDRFPKMEQEMERLLQQIEWKEIPDEITVWRSTMPCRKNINNRAVIPIRVKSRVSFRAWRLVRKVTGKRYLRSQRRGENEAGSGVPAAEKTGHTVPGRADQPS